MRKNFKNEGYQDFSEYQLQMLNKDFYNMDRKISLESVLAKLMKHSENNILKMSLSKLHEISCYGRYKAMARSYFYELVDQLMELKLVKRVGRKIHIIISPDNLPDKMEVAESVETTELDGNSKKPNIKYNIYTNTLNIKEKNFVDEIVPLAAASNKILELCNVANIKNKLTKKIICDMIINRLKKYNIELRQSYCDTYLLKCIFEKYNFIKSLNFNKIANTNIISSSRETFEKYYSGIIL